MPSSITFVSFARTESALHNSVFTYTTCNVLGLCKRLVRCILLIWLTAGWVTSTPTALFAQAQLASPQATRAAAQAAAPPSPARAALRNIETFRRLSIAIDSWINAVGGGGVD